MPKRRFRVTKRERWGVISTCWAWAILRCSEKCNGPLVEAAVCDACGVALCPGNWKLILNWLWPEQIKGRRYFNIKFHDRRCSMRSMRCGELFFNLRGWIGSSVIIFIKSLCVYLPVPRYLSMSVAPALCRLVSHYDKHNGCHSHKEFHNFFERAHAIFSSQKPGLPITVTVTVTAWQSQSLSLPLSLSLSLLLFQSWVVY